MPTMSKSISNSATNFKAHSKENSNPNKHPAIPCQGQKHPHNRSHQNQNLTITHHSQRLINSEISIINFWGGSKKKKKTRKHEIESDQLPVVVVSVSPI